MPDYVASSGYDRYRFGPYKVNKIHACKLWGWQIILTIIVSDDFIIFTFVGQCDWQSVYLDLIPSPELRSPSIMECWDLD